MESGMHRNILQQPDVAQNLIENRRAEVAAFAKALLAKRQIFLVGTGASLNAALAAVPAFARFAGKVPAVVPASEVAYYTHLFGEDAAVVLISQSGGSFETKQMCQLMQQRRLPFWGITNEADSHLAKTATYPLLMGAGKEVSSATKTHMATLLLLYMAAGFENAAAQSALAKIPACVQQTINACLPVLDDVAEGFLKTQSMYVLGDNVNGATARQGALMLKEKCFIKAEGMTASEFRHGAVEVVQPGLQFLYAAPSAENRAESETHMAYLQKLDCDVALVATGRPQNIAQNRFLPVAHCGEDAFSQLCATLPLQLLAERVAAMNGYDVDGFRYLSKVVADY